MAGAGMSPGASDGEGNKENVSTPSNTINSKILQEIIFQIQRSYTRNRKVRIKLLNRINMHFYKISEMLEQNDVVQCLIIEHVEELQNVILETTKLCVGLSEPSARIPEIYATVYDLGSYFETITIGAFTWCINNGKLFGQFMGKFLTSLIKVSSENPATWLYYVIVSPTVLHILNAMFRDDHNDFRRRWAPTVVDLMKQLPKALFGCGDFGCQFYLLTVLHAWTQWIHSGLALPAINSAFSFVEPSARKQFLMSDQSEKVVRNFLNSFNLSARGPKSVIPILCSYLFVGGCKLNTEEVFWVDFSVVSGRIHTFYSIPGTPLISLGIRKDHIDSICLNWVVNDGRSQAQEMESQLETQESTASTFMKNEKVLFFHVVLNVDFEDISRDIESLIGKKYRSVYLVFRDGDLVEKVMKEMNYAQHVCGTMNCQRPRKLRQMLASQNVTYTQSWCPESQVFGLDKSPLDATRSFMNQTDPDSTLSRIQRLTSPGRASITPGTSFCLDVSSAENTQSQTQDFKEQTVSSDTSKSSFFPIAASAPQTPSAFYVSMTSAEEFTMSPEEVNAATDGRMDITTATNDTLEDPLPAKGRKKFSHLFKHNPFQKNSSFNQEERNVAPLSELEPANSSERQQRASGSVDAEHSSTQSESLTVPQYITRVRNSSPKPYACIQVRSPPTPPVSEICSPAHRVFNATITEIEEDRQLENASFQSSFHDLSTTYPFLAGSGGRMGNENNEISLSQDFTEQDSLFKANQEYETGLKITSPSAPEIELYMAVSETVQNVIPESPSSERSSSQENPERSPSLSPIVGYSKILLRRPMHSTSYTTQEEGENRSCDLSDTVDIASPDELSIISDDEMYWTPSHPSRNSLNPDSSPKKNDKDSKNDSPKTPVRTFKNKPIECEMEPSVSVTDKTLLDRNPHSLEQSPSSSFKSQEYGNECVETPPKVDNAKSSSRVVESEVCWTPTPPSQPSSPEMIDNNKCNDSIHTPVQITNQKALVSPSCIMESEPGEVFWTPTPPFQTSLPEMRNGEGCKEPLQNPIQIPIEKSIMSPSRISESDDESFLSEAPLQLNAERSPSLSPIIGFSKTWLQKSQATPEMVSTPPAQNSRQSPKLPCYAYAHQLRETTLTEKLRNPDYDPYDLWTCSEMEIYKQQVFPELKRRTYGRGKKPTWEHKINARKRKVSKSSSSSASRKRSAAETSGNGMPEVEPAPAASGPKKMTPLKTIQKSALKKKAKPGFRPLKLNFKRVGKSRD